MIQVVLVPQTAKKWSDAQIVSANVDQDDIDIKSAREIIGCDYIDILNPNPIGLVLPSVELIDQYEACRDDEEREVPISLGTKEIQEGKSTLVFYNIVCDDEARLKGTGVNRIASFLLDPLCDANGRFIYGNVIIYRVRPELPLKVKQVYSSIGFGDDSFVSSPPIDSFDDELWKRMNGAIWSCDPYVDLNCRLMPKK